jgi:hypothetical protein
MNEVNNDFIADVRLSYYTIESLHLESGRIERSNRLAVSAKDALRLERSEFGEPIYRVLRAYPKPN